jgi:hypothetical protein
VPLNYNKWCKSVPDSAAFQQKILDLYIPDVPWLYTGAEMPFERTIPPLYTSLSTECQGDFESDFCRHVAQFINNTLLQYVRDDGNMAFIVADNIMGFAGQALASAGMPDYVKNHRFYPAAGFQRNPGALKDVLDTYWS